MTTATEAKTKPKAIPTQDEIEDKYKWNLQDIYKSEDDWEADYKKAQGLIEKAKEYMGKLASSAELLYNCLETRSELLLTVANLYQYARLSLEIPGYDRPGGHAFIGSRGGLCFCQAGAVENKRGEPPANGRAVSQDRRV